MRSRHILRTQERATRLLGPDGQPIVSKKDTEIPFIRYNPSPGVERGLQTIDRGLKVYAQALPFLSRGGQYVCRITPAGKAHLVAGLPVKGGARGELAIVAEETVENRPDVVGVAVDRLVAESAANMDAVIAGETHLAQARQ